MKSLENNLQATVDVGKKVYADLSSLPTTVAVCAFVLYLNFVRLVLKPCLQDSFGSSPSCVAMDLHGDLIYSWILVKVVKCFSE